MTTDCPTPVQSEALHSEIYFPSSRVPCRNRTTSLRMEASCKQRCNVVEQTPSRLRVAAHFVCSIYQSKADNEIYEWNKGSHRLRVNNRSQWKRDIPFFLSLFLKGQNTKAPGKNWKYSASDASKRPSKTIRAAFEEVRSDARKNSWQ